MLLEGVITESKIEVEVSDEQIQECIDGHLEECYLTLHDTGEVQLWGTPLYNKDDPDFITYRKKSLPTLVGNLLEGRCIPERITEDLASCDKLKSVLLESIALIDEYVKLRKSGLGSDT